MTYPDPPSPQDPSAPDESSPQAEAVDAFAAEPPADEPSAQAVAAADQSSPEPDVVDSFAAEPPADEPAQAAPADEPAQAAPAAEPAPAERTLADEDPAAPADAVTPSPAPSTEPQEEPPVPGDVPVDAPADAPADVPADVPAAPAADAAAAPVPAVGEPAPAEHTLLDEQPAPADATPPQPSDAPASAPVDEVLVPPVVEPAAPIDLTEPAQAPEPDAGGDAAEPQTALAPPVPATLVDAPGDRATAGARDARRSRAWIPVTAVAVTVALLAAAAGFLGWRVRQQAQAEQARDEAVAAARDAARLLFSYNHESLEQDFEKGAATTTGEFREQYARTTKQVVTPVAERYDAVVVAEVIEAAVVSASADEVTALVFLNQATTSTRVQGQQVDQSRVRMRLVERDGRWLVEAVEAL